MSVENFFPEHYPWQRLLSDIHKKLVPEESEDDTMVVELVISTNEGGDTTFELQITAGELLEAMKTKFVAAISFNEELSRVDVFPILCGRESIDPAGYSFIGIDANCESYTFSADTASDKPLYTLL